MISTIKALILGDVVGLPGCRALFWGLQSIIKKTGAEVVIANGENASDGFGLVPETAEGFFKAGVDVITSGNHIWQRKEILPMLDAEQRILRPHNYPLGVPGHGCTICRKRNAAVAVLNLEGRVHLSNLRCPFKVGKETARRLRSETPVIVIDFHAEMPQEKEALGLYLDGQVSLVAGTHTHVQTADERILAGGTAYITDIGMTGPTNSVIGMIRETSIKRSLTQMPIKMEVQDSTPVIMGVLVEVDVNTGKSISISRLQQELPNLQ